MGAALDSFVITMEYAGIVTIILLALCLISRFRNNSGSLNVFQRMPLLLPALGFVITVMLVTSAGITPMAQYQGVNSRSVSFESGDSISFTLKDNLFYAHSLETEGTYYLEFNQSIYIVVIISQDGTIVETFTHNLQYSSMQNPAISVDTASLSPGTYNVQVDYTFYEGGVPMEGQTWLHLTFTQPLTDGYIEELVNWTSFQFTINISCIAIFLGGLCIGTSQKGTQRGQPRREEPDRNKTSEYDW